jgi:hypothetical protein
MLFADSIVMTDTSMMFMNKVSQKEFIELMMKISTNAIEDLSKITGISAEELFEDYLYKHDYNVVREVLKKKHPGENFDLPTLVDMWIEHYKE